MPTVSKQIYHTSAAQLRAGGEGHGGDPPWLNRQHRRRQAVPHLLLSTVDKGG